MHRYTVTVDGITYRVQVAPCRTKQRPCIPQGDPGQESLKSREARRGQVPASLVQRQERKILAPMAGWIASIQVAVGDAVQSGQCLFILEAMKMKNRVLSPQAGVVIEIAVTEEEWVQKSDLLAVLD